jgi:3-oxoacyl-[acyl-carrier protein] reductase
MFRLDGKVALVTGATGGIGEAIARTLHAQGAQVAITGRREAELARVAEQLGGTRVLVAPADLTDPAAPAALVEQVEASLGSLDILVNNAGFTRDMLALRMGDADWNAVLEVDLTAPFRLARAALRGMMKRRHGRIVSIASIVGVTGNAGQANYAAAKAGLIGLSKSLAQEVATRGVTVNVVAPGFVKTAMTDSLPEAARTALLARIPSQRMGAPEDVAAAVAYLASAEAGWVTGQTLHVNGGMAMI